MVKLFHNVVLSFIPICVAVDAIANIPIFLSLVENCSKKQRRKIIHDTVVTAASVAVIFVCIGKWVFSLLGVTVADFQIAGGLLLFVLSVRLLFPGAHKDAFSAMHDRDIGVFPLGTPLITGPAVLTTTLMMVNSFGVTATLIALILNMIIVWVALVKADVIIKFAGSGGTRAFSKIMYILLAAIAVMMVRNGITGALLR
jgi:multiple antibiotic resistance protein